MTTVLKEQPEDCKMASNSMSSNANTIWRCIVEDTTDYGDSIDGKAYFDKIVSLWKEYPNAVSNRITTSISIDDDSPIWEEIMEVFETQYHFSPREASEVSMTKFIHRDQKNRKFSDQSFEVSFYQEELLVRFYPVVRDGLRHPHFELPYQIGCQLTTDSSIRLQIFKPIDAPDEKYEFLKSVGFKTIFTWLKGIDLSKTSRKTNSLMDKESYTHTYRRIRDEFGRPMIEKWTENSNPQKTVFEDCAIAAYIYELVSSGIIPKPKKFVDMGCGNGLLVYLLNLIGMAGYGVDVRRRKIWNTTLKHVDLRETTVDPQKVVQNEPHFDADVDFLIGNHSDELTPWIPVMAAKLNCNFFVIPCCPFDFFGKYRNDGSHLGPKRMVSQYESFFEWTVTVAERMGFFCRLDRLAIPSTKRLCIIGTVPADTGLCPNIDETIEIMTEGKKFEARPRAIKMNNCMNIPISDRDRIAKKMFDYVLNASDEVRDGWHCGGEVPLGELATILTDEEKKMMKDQDGGLQTFLRNHHQIFHVYQAVCHLRDFRQPQVSKRPAWKPRNPDAPRIKYPCWMALYHPDGCAVGQDACRYEH